VCFSLSSLLVHCSGAPRALHSFPTRRSSDLPPAAGAADTIVVRHAAVNVGARSLTDWPKPASLLPALATSPDAVAFGEVYLTWRSEEHTSELQSQSNLVCRLLLEKKKKNNKS